MIAVPVGEEEVGDGGERRHLFDVVSEFRDVYAAAAVDEHAVRSVVEKIDMAVFVVGESELSAANPVDDVGEFHDDAFTTVQR